MDTSIDSAPELIVARTASDHVAGGGTLAARRRIIARKLGWRHGD